MAIAPENSRKFIPTAVKDSALVEERRSKIVEAAVKLFIHKGFHATTTREIARSSGVSVGLLYEYISSKEDILYLVCESIHGEMGEQLSKEVRQGASAEETLRRAISGYLRVCDRMQDSILLIYRETASLVPESQRYVLENEQRIAKVFEDILEAGNTSGVFRLRDRKAVQLMAHNIIVLGHMWAFRRWFLRDHFTLDEYVEHQTSLIMREVTG